MPPINVTSNNNNNNNIFSYIIDLEIQLYLNKINYKIALTYKKKKKVVLSKDSVLVLGDVRNSKALLPPRPVII
jgi:hypothetical protein